MEREQRTQTKDGAREKTSRRRYLIIFLDHRPRQLHWLHAPRYPAAKGVGQRSVPAQADSSPFSPLANPSWGGRAVAASDPAVVAAVAAAVVAAFVAAADTAVVSTEYFTLITPTTRDSEDSEVSFIMSKVRQ